MFRHFQTRGAKVPKQIELKVYAPVCESLRLSSSETTSSIDTSSLNSPSSVSCEDIAPGFLTASRIGLFHELGNL